MLGVRDPQSGFPDRAGAAKFGWDKRFGLWKLNPLADWTDEQIWNHIRETKCLITPSRPGLSLDRVHPLHLRPAAESDTRSGRWAGPTRTECGING